MDEQLRFDAHIEVYGATSTLRLQYDTPYVRHLPTVLVREVTRGDAFHRSISPPHLKDPYTLELEAFHAAITEGAEVKTTAEDFVEDLEIFTDIIEALRAGRRWPEVRSSPAEHRRRCWLGLTVVSSARTDIVTRGAHHA